MNSTFLREIVPGILAVVIIGTLCVLAVIEVLRHEPLMFPPFIEGVAGIIVGYFFTHTAASNAAVQIVNGLQAAKPVVITGRTTVTTGDQPTPTAG